ncbi:MAG: hypothetical protein Q8O67_11790 [Deltaproteobacteria bacterium]|nr:hypothetical protein [Deltaproteobacteria bacterium]
MTRICVATAALLFAGGCFDAAVPADVELLCTATAQCPNRTVCFVIAGEVGRCVGADTACMVEVRERDRQGAVEDETACVVGGGEGACFAGLCLAARCGDGVENGADECDDGNGFDTDGCTSACLLARCRDGILRDGGALFGLCADGDTTCEECDDGNAGRGDGCDDNCRVERCGNGRQDEGEECEAANADDATCTPACRRPVCGDGFIERDVEACDDGDTLAGDGCAADCSKVERCGDGVVDVAAGEGCDDGNANPSDGCDDGCHLTRWVARAVTGAGPPATDNLVAFADASFDGVFLASSHRVLRVDAATGLLTHVAGDGQRFPRGVDDLATRASFGGLSGVFSGVAGGLFALDRVETGRSELLRIDGATRLLTRVVDPANGSTLDNVTSGATTSFGDFFFLQGGTLRRIDAATDAIVAVPTFLPPGERPTRVVVDADDRVLVGTDANHVRRVDGDGTPDITLHRLSAFAVAPDGTLVGRAGRDVVHVDALDTLRLIAPDAAPDAVFADRLGGVWLARAATVSRFDLDEAVAAANSGSPLPTPTVMVRAGVAPSELRALESEPPDGAVAVDAAGRPCLLQGSKVLCAGADDVIREEADLPGAVDLVRAVDDPATLLALVQRGPDAIVVRITRGVGVVDVVAFASVNARRLAVDTSQVLVASARQVFAAPLAGGAVVVLAGSGADPGATPAVDGPAATTAIAVVDVDVAADGAVLVADERQIVWRVAGGALTRPFSGGSAAVVALHDVVALPSGAFVLISGGDRDLGPSIVQVQDDGAATVVSRDQGFLNSGMRSDDDVLPADAIFCTAGRAAAAPDGALVVRSVCEMGLEQLVGNLTRAGGEAFVWRVSPTTPRRIGILWGRVEPSLAPFAQASLDAPTGVAVAPDGALLIASGLREALTSPLSGTTGGFVMRVDVDVGRVDAVVGHRFGAGVTGRARSAPMLGALGGIGLAGQQLLVARAGLLQVVDLVDPAQPSTWVTGPPLAVLPGPPGALAIRPGTDDVVLALPGDHTIRRGDGSLVAGRPGLPGFAGDGASSNARFRSPRGVIVDDDGTIFIADTGNGRVRAIDPAGEVRTVFFDPAGLPAPRALALDTRGNLVVAGGGAITLIPRNAQGQLEARTALALFTAIDPLAGVTRCLAGVTFRGDDELYAVDECTGLLLELRREAVP